MGGILRVKIHQEPENVVNLSRFLSNQKITEPFTSMKIINYKPSL